MDWVAEIQKLDKLTVFVLVQITLVIAFFLRGNSKALRDNTHAVIKLEVEMRNCVEKLSSVPKLEKDVGALGSALREMRDKLKAATK